MVRELRPVPTGQYSCPEDQDLQAKGKARRSVNSECMTGPCRQMRRLSGVSPQSSDVNSIERRWVKVIEMAAIPSPFASAALRGANETMSLHLFVDPTAQMTAINLVPSVYH